MQSGSLKDCLVGKYIICACEGIAEKAVVDLLLDHDKLCFAREDLVRRDCTRIRRGDNLAQEYLNQEYKREVVILRILDREQEKFKLPRIYRHVPIYNVVTKPEIEILHILAEHLEFDFQKQKKNLKAGEFCKIHFRNQDVKSKDFIESLYAANVEKLVDAIKRYDKSKQKAYCLRDLLA